MIGKTTKDYIAEAVEGDPKGRFCGWCDKPNDNADDIGWWYLTPFGNQTEATCNSCSEFLLPIHQVRYGVGER